MTTEQTSSTPAPPAAQTAPKKLRPIQALGLGLVGMGYGPTLATLGAYLIIYSPNGPILTIVVVFVAIFAVAGVVAFFARQYVGRGGMLTYAYRTAGHVAGYLMGATLLLGNILLVAVIVASSAIFGISAASRLGIDASGTTAQIVVLAIIGSVSTLVCLRGLRSAADIGSILGLVCLPFIAWVLIQGGVTMGIDVDAIFLFDPPTFDPGTFVFGLVLIASAFFGFEQLTTLAADTESPRRSIPLVLFGCVIVGIPVAVLSLVFGAAIGTQKVDELVAGASPLSILADAAGLGWMSVPLDLLVFAAALALQIAVQTYGSQLLSTMGEIGLLPRWFAFRGKRWGIAFRSVITIGLVSILVPIIVAVVTAGGPIDTAIYLTEPIGFIWSIAYIIIGVLALWLVARARSGWLTALCAVVVILGFGALMVFALKDGFSTVFSTEAWLVVIAIGVVFLAFWALHKVRTRTGSIDLTKLDDVE